MYRPGEERFGRTASWLYSFSSLFLRGFHRFVVADILSFNPSSVLDIGCGSGDVLSHLASERVGVELFGVDPSPYMLKIAEKRIRRHAVSRKTLDQRLHLSLGSSRDIPFKRKFDLIYSSLSFHHWVAREASVAGILDSLSGGGTFVIYELSREGQPIFRSWLTRGHSLPLRDAEAMDFNGYERTILQRGGYIKVAFMKRP